jgi:hypothetical protein
LQDISLTKEKTFVEKKIYFIILFSVLKDFRKELIRFGEILTLRISFSEFGKGETAKLDTDLENFEKLSDNLFPWLTIAIGSSLTVVVFVLLTILCFLFRRLNQTKENNKKEYEMEKHWQEDEWPENIQPQDQDLPKDLPEV